MSRILILLTLLTCLVGCGGAPVASADTLPAIDEPVYTLEEDIGMMLLVGFRGTEIDSNVNMEIIRALRDYHVGSVILFDYDAPTATRGRNIKNADQVRTLCTQLRQYNPHLLIGVDQEGGYVSRLSPNYGFPRIPSAKHCAELGLDTMLRYAALTGEMLADVGINLNFAPVADVDVNPRCPVIGGIERSFSADEQRVEQYCKAWVEVQARYGVASCMKHFPGHGSAMGDTHKGIVDVTATWQRRELEPYRHIDSATTMVMTAHVINRQLDPQGLPASLSPTITTFLRDSLGFRGVIVTDDLAMGAIVGQYSFERAVRMAVLAGADMLCLSNNGGGTYDVQMVPRAVEVIRQMVDSGEVSQDRIHLSASRVRRLARR